MSFAASARSLFASSTAASSARFVTRTQSTTAAVRRAGVRWYSEQASPAPEQPSEQTKDAPKDDKLAELEKKLKSKEEEVVDLTGRLRYLQADFLNLQRNSAREKEQTRDFAITRFATDLLETVDVLSLALKSVPPAALQAPSDSTPAATSSEKTADAHLRDLHQGVEITQRQLLATLFKYHVKPFDPVGDKFDPHFHEAMYQAPVPGKEPGTVIDCQKVGYKIKDRVLRAAQVGVAQDTS